MRAEAMAAPRSAGCSGPEKISVLPQVRTRRAVSASGNTSTAPLAANALASETTTTVRGWSGPRRARRRARARPSSSCRARRRGRDGAARAARRARARRRSARGRRACCRSPSARYQTRAWRRGERVAPSRPGDPSGCGARSGRRPPPPPAWAAPPARCCEPAGRRRPRPALPIEDRQRREVRQRRGLRDHQRRLEDRAQQALELAVGRAGDVGARRRELHAEAGHGVAGGVLEPQVGLEPEVGARAEVDVLPAVQRDEPAVELLVLGDQVAEPARDPVAEGVVDQAQPRIDRRSSSPIAAPPAPVHAGEPGTASSQLGA